MKNKIVFLLTVIFLVSLLCFSFVACNNDETNSSNESFYKYCEYIDNNDGTITFARYSKKYEDNVFYIPESIDGKTVTEVFSNCLVGQDNIKEIVLPKTLKKINTSAFSGLNYLEKVSFDSNAQPQLEIIGYGAFQGCKNLNNFNSSHDGSLIFPDSVKIIHSQSFYGTNFINVYISSNVTHIGDTAFSNILRLRNIVAENNSTYFSENGVLYNSDGWLMQYPTGITENSFSVPTAVSNVQISNIAQFAFMNETDLTSISLNNINSIAEYAFKGCTNLSTFTNATNVEYVAPYALDDLPIMSQESNFVTLGKVLYKYKGHFNTLSEEDFPEGLIRISTNAFSNNTSITTIYLPKRIRHIGSQAFNNCINLESIIYKNKSLPNIQTNSFINLSPKFKFYCDANLINNIPSDSKWYPIRNILADRTILFPTYYSVLFKNGNEGIGSFHINTGDEYSLTQTSYTINSVSKDFTGHFKMINCAYKDYYGYNIINNTEVATFVGWSVDGKLLQSSGVWQTYEEPILEAKAVWAPTVFNIKIFNDNNTLLFDENTNYFDGITLPDLNLNKEGFEFIGWQTEDYQIYQPNETIYPLSNITLKPKWSRIINNN